MKQSLVADILELPVAERVRLGKVPVGQITLAPHWKADYVALVRKHLAKSSAPAHSPIAAAR